MNTAPLPPCPRTDAVLAIYLDGDADAEASGFQFACADSLAEHLRDCAPCRLQLQRARRLDAVLAENAGRLLAAHTGGADGLEARAAAWFAAERFAPKALLVRPAVAAAEPRRSAPRWASPVAAALAGVGLVLAVWSAGRAEGRPAAGPIRMATAAPATVTQVIGTQVIGTQVIGTPVIGTPVIGAPAIEAPAIGPAPQAVVAAPAPAIRVAGDAARFATRLADARATQPKVAFDREAKQRRLADPKLAPGLRVAAAQRLLESARPGSDGSSAAFAALTGVLAAGQPGASGLAAMVAIHEVAAGESPFVAHLRAALQRLDHPRSVPGLDDFAALAVAARLDRRDLDAAVQRAVRRHPELATVLAAALRSGIRQRGTATLLLDAWDGLTARGALADDERAAQMWFAGQPEATFAAVREELAAARSAPRRVRCLLALGAGPDDEDGQNRAVLVAWTAAACRDEAYAAAFALAQHVATNGRALDPVVAKAAQDRDAYLLRAALARAGLAEAEAWVAPLSLTGAERALLTGCAFDRFPAVAAWFRDPLASHPGSPVLSSQPSGD